MLCMFLQHAELRRRYPGLSSKAKHPENQHRHKAWLRPVLVDHPYRHALGFLSLHPDAGHLLMAEWNNSVGRPCHYVAADLANHCIVVAIRCVHILLPSLEPVLARAIQGGVGLLVMYSEDSCRPSKTNLLSRTAGWTV